MPAAGLTESSDHPDDVPTAACPITVTAWIFFLSLVSSFLPYLPEGGAGVERDQAGTKGLRGGNPFA